MRIFRNKWMTRLWTLQEGALAARLAFQFADYAVEYEYVDGLMLAAVVDVDDVARLVGNRANHSLSGIACIKCPSTIGITQVHKRYDTYPSLWSALRHRSTSRPSDEAICAAILLGVDLELILDAPNEKKMEAFWTNQNEVPTGVLWVNGSRMDVDTLRWAPKSLLDPRTWALSFPKGDAWARRTSAGLIFHGIEAVALTGCTFPDSSKAVVEFIDPSSQVTYYISKSDNVGNASWADLEALWTDIALLWREQPTSEIFTAGTLVSCDSTSSGVKHARWLT